jgi:hypothetical protein
MSAPEWKREIEQRLANVQAARVDPLEALRCE